MVTALHPSWAVATPVRLVPVSVIGHSSVTLGGQVMMGFKVSRTVMVCRQLTLLLHASVAVQVRAMTLLPAQLLVVTSLERMVTALQVSWAVATPQAFVLVSAGHSKSRSGGQARLGLRVSRTVSACTQLTLLEQPSVAVQVRAMTLEPPQLVVIESLYWIVTALQASCAVATPQALVLVSAGHSRIWFGGQVMVGLRVSRTVMVCRQEALLPQSSVAVQVRAITLVPAQLLL